MKNTNSDRRRFIKQFGLAVATIPALEFGLSCMTRSEAERNHALASIGNAATNQSSCEWCGAGEAPPDTSARTTIAPANEPGQRMIIGGTIFQPDGATPASGITLYVYHTDVTGQYSHDRANDGRLSWRHGRLRGWMRTGANGQYEFNTIRPTGYPGRPDPAHIHITLYGTDYPEYWIDDYWFDGDPRITSERLARLTGRGSFSPIVRLIRDDQGVLRGTRNIRLQRINA